MSKHCGTDENKKEVLIHKLLLQGVFKKGDLHLFELSLDELEKEFIKITNS